MAQEPEQAAKSSLSPSLTFSVLCLPFMLAALISSSATARAPRQSTRPSERATTAKVDEGAKPGAFWISVEVPASPVSPNIPPTSITCDANGQLLCVYGRKTHVLMLDEKRLLRIKKAGQVFIDAPPPFLTADAGVLDGKSLFVEVYLSGKSRCCWVYSWLPPIQVRQLVDSLSAAIEGLPVPDAKGRALAQACKELRGGEEIDVSATLKMWEQMEELRKQVLLRIPNADPVELVATVAGTPHKNWSNKWRANCLGFLASLRHVALGKEILEVYRSHPEYDTDTKLQILHASILGGCLDGIAEFEPLLTKTLGKESGNLGLELEGTILDVISQSALRAMLQKLKLQKLDASNAPRVWRWIVTKRRQLRFDSATHKYEMVTVERQE